MPASGSPKTRTSPAVGRSNPAATLRSVDLPHPVGPTTETNSPSAIASETSFTAVYEPRLLVERGVAGLVLGRHEVDDLLRRRLGDPFVGAHHRVHDGLHRVGVFLRVLLGDVDDGGVIIAAVDVLHSLLGAAIGHGNE